MKEDSWFSPSSYCGDDPEKENFTSSDKGYSYYVDVMEDRMDFDTVFDHCRDIIAELQQEHEREKEVDLPPL